MSIHDFKSMSMNEQAKTAWEKGVHLMSREAGRAKYILYQVEGLYVEFQYTTAGNTLTGIKSFLNPDLLDPYF